MYRSTPFAFFLNTCHSAFVVLSNFFTARLSFRVVWKTDLYAIGYLLVRECTPKAWEFGEQ